MSLKAARARPLGSRANATDCTAMRKTSVRIEILLDNPTRRGKNCRRRLPPQIPPLGSQARIPLALCAEDGQQFLGEPLKAIG